MSETPLEPELPDRQDQRVRDIRGPYDNAILTIWLQEKVAELEARIVALEEGGP